MAAWIYLNLYFRDIGISYFELGLADAWAMGLGLIAMLIGGYWADKYIPHRKWMATFNKFFITIACFTIAITTDLLGLFLAWTVFGFSQFCQASIDPILFESLPPKHLGTGTSLFTLGGVFGLVGLVFVGFLITNDFVSGLRIFWYLAAISSAIDFFLRFFFLKKTSPTQDPEENGATNLTQDVFLQYLTGFKVLAATIPLFLIVFVIDAMSDINYRFAQNFFLNEDIGMEYVAINYTMIGVTIIGIIGGLFAGSLLDKSQDESKVMFLAYFLLPFSIILLLYSQSIPKWTNSLSNEGAWSVIASTAFIAVVIKGGNDMVWRTIAWGAVGRKLPREHTGKVMAILSIIIQTLGVVVSPIAGYIYQTQGGQPLLIVALFLNLMILCLLFLGWVGKNKKAERPLTTAIAAVE